MKQTAIISLLFLFVNINLISQTDINNLRNISTEVNIVKKGISQNSVRSIFQDSSGFMWFGTWDGLNRYDGHEFLSIDISSNINSGLNSYTINYINQYHINQLYLATEAGVSILNTQTFKAKPLNENYSDTVYHFTWDSINNKLWIAGHNGLRIYDFDKNILNNKDFIKSEILATSEIRDIILINDFAYVATENDIQKIKTDKPWLQNTLVDFIDSISITDIENFRDSLILISSEKGFFSYDLFKDSLIEYNYKNNNEKLISLSILIDDEERVFIGSSGQGLLELNFDRKSISKINKSFYANNNNSESFRNEYINFMYQSSGGLIWCGSAYNGVYYFEKGVHYFQHFMGEKSDNLNISSSNVWNFNYIDNKLWIATRGGINIYNPQNQSLEILDESDGLASNECRYIFKDSRDNVWIATNDAGVHVYNLESKKFTTHYHTKSSKYNISDNNVWHVAEDNNGYIWLATLNGLNRINYIKNEVKVFKRIPDSNSISSNHVYNILVDDDKLWIATLNGLNLYENGKFTVFKHRQDDSNSLSTNKLFSITKGEMNNLWIATWGGGLNRFNIKTKRVDFFTTKNGLSNNVVYNIINTNDGYLWMSTNNGISKFNIFSEQFDNFYVEDGVQSAEFNLNAAYYSQSGNVFFGGVNGFNVFDPEDLKNVGDDFNFTFSGFDVNGNTVSYNVHNNDTVVLKNFENNFLLKFSSLNFNNNKTLYKYFVLSDLKDWKEELTSNNYIELQNLSPGDYHIRVKATNSRGQWMPNYHNLYLKIMKPWYKTLAFYLSSTLSIIIIISLLVYYQMRRLRIRSENREKIHKLEKQALKLQMNPHFIFNTLNAIQSFVFDNDKKESTKYLSKFSKLMRMMLNTSGMDSITLKEELQMMDYYLQLEALRFDNKFSYEIIIDDEIDDDFIEIPTMLIQPFIENAVIHGVAPLETRKGKIIIKVTQQKDVLEIKIIDNGVGRKYHRENRNDSEHKSKGMSITKQRLDLINQDYNDIFGLQIIDLDDERGTEVIITLKV